MTIAESRAALDSLATLFTAGAVGRLTDAELLARFLRGRGDVASEADLQMRMQGIVLLGGFLKLTPYAVESGMTDEEVYAGVEKALRKYFGKRGEQVVQDNLTCVKRGYSEMREIPPELIQVFKDLAIAFGALMAAGAVLFGVIRGGVALFKLAGRIFSAAGA